MVELDYRFTAAINRNAFDSFKQVNIRATQSLLDSLLNRQARV
jgi:hypothetical protein